MQYNIHGDNMPVVICSLDDGESMICEAGAMSWMTPNMQMETKSGGAGKLFGRVFSGESAFQNYYTARNGSGLIAFASNFPGDILAVEVTPEKPVIIQKRAFLACTAGVQSEVFFQKKLGTAIFGGEGFIMQKLSGQGMAFLEIDGSAVEYELAAGQQMIVQTGSVAMMDASCQMDVQTVKGVKNALFGGEGLFNTVITGPGKVILQTMPITGFAAAIAEVMPSSNK